MSYLWTAIVMAWTAMAFAATDEQTMMPAPWHCRAGDVVRIQLVNENRQPDHSDVLSGRIIRILPDEQVRLEAERDVLMDGVWRKVILQAVAKVSDFHLGNRILSSSLQDVELLFDPSSSVPAVGQKWLLLRLLSRTF